MRRLTLSIVILTLSLIGAVIAPQQAKAEPLPAAYSGFAGGDVVAFDLDVTTGLDLAGARLAVTESTADGGATPSATAMASNLGAAVTGLGIAVDAETQTAPPDNPTPDTGTIGGASAPGLLSYGLLTSSVQARSEAAVVCTTPSGAMLASSKVQTTGAILNPTAIGTVFDTGDAMTAGEVSIVPEPLSDPLNRAVLSTATGSITSNFLLNGGVQVDITGQPKLQAIATGEPGGADVSYTPGTVTVTAGSTTTTIDPGDFGTFTFPVPGGQVDITVNDETSTEAPDGQSATGSVAVVTAEITVASGGGPTLATATVDLLPLRVAANAPPDGIDCPPVLNNPADGSTTTDTTPTFNGIAAPGSEVEILVDGDPIGTTTATPAGLFSFTPATPLPAGEHTATATQTTEGGTSQESNANDFTIVGPPVLEDPADGTVTNDPTPTFTGTAIPGAQVDILVDGSPIGTTTADPDGTFSFTPATGLPAGNHQASATATVNGVGSGPSNINDFVIDVEGPAVPTLNEPADGAVINDTTPTFTGRAEPGAEVEIFVDGTSIGITTANGGGAFSFTPATPLAAGRHEAFVGGTDAAGNDSPPSNTNAFRIDTNAPAPPVITSPDDGSTTIDPTFPIRGTAEPGSQVIIIKDGEEIGSTVADEDGNFTFNLPSGLLPVGRYGFSARAVDEAGNSSAAAEPVYVEVFGASASIDDGSGQSLADTGGPQGWVTLVAVLGVLAGAGVLGVARWRRRSSHVEL